MRHDFSVLSPVRFLDRAAAVHPREVAVVDGDDTYTYAEFHARARRLAGALFERDLRAGGRVAVLATNTLEMLEAHYGVPYGGGVLVPLDPRLDASEIAHILEHSDTQILIVAEALAAVGREAIELSGADITVLVAGEQYEAALAAAMPYQTLVSNELSPIAINYTNGATGSPKGVVYSHRGAYLQAFAMAFHSGMSPESTYLWTLPMSHCNGWCFTWAVTAVGATHICLENVDAGGVWAAVDQHQVTHLCAAPAVLSMMTTEPAKPVDLDHFVWAATGGAPPAPALLARARRRGLEVTHLYGMTETYGPIAVNEWRSDWDELPAGKQDRLRARQGIASVVSEPVRVLDAEGRDVPADATTVGEVAVRGNNVLPEYHRDPEATAVAIPDGWFRTGDLGVRHPDGYLELVTAAQQPPGRRQADAARDEGAHDA